MKGSMISLSRRALLGILTTIFFTLYLLSGYTVKAETQKQNIVLLIDNSGSMTDSGLGKLAKVASNMLLDTVKEEEANIGIITFGEKTTVLSDIAKQESFSTIKSLVSGIAFDENYTNMKDGLSKAIESLSKSVGDKNIIILTDGKETAPGGLPKNHASELDALVQKAKSAEIKVNAIALGADIERTFLNKITTETEGSFQDGMTADKLYNALANITGIQNDFLTVANYTTDKIKNQKIKLSSMISEVIINAAACDNINPKLEVKLDGKVIEPLKSGDLYYVYRFENNVSSELEISSLGNMDTAVIVQLKSKAKLDISGETENYLSIPTKVPIAMNINLDCAGAQIPEGTFIQRNGISIDSYSNTGNFTDVYEGEKVGQDTVTYTAKDGNGGIIAVAKIEININNYPPYYYESTVNSLIQGDSLTVTIIPKDTTEVINLGGTLVVKHGSTKEEIPLELQNNKLVAQRQINNTGGLEYYVYIRGTVKSNFESFEYKLPIRTVTVGDRPTISLGLTENEPKNVKMNNATDITLDILPTSIIPRDISVDVYDSQNNKIGNFEVKANSSGEINVKVTPIEYNKNLQLNFKTENGVDITKTLNTNIKVFSGYRYIYEQYGKPILAILGILILITLIGTGIYLFGVRIYLNFIEENSKQISISYSTNILKNGDTIIFQLSNKINNLYLNYNFVNGDITVEDEYLNSIGEFLFINTVDKYPKWLQGYIFIFKGEKIFKTVYKPIEEQDVIDNELEEDIFGIVNYKESITITYKYGKRVTTIEF